MDNPPNNDDQAASFKVTEEDIIDLFSVALTSPVCNLQTKEMVVSAIMKLSVRFGPAYTE